MYYEGHLAICRKKKRFVVFCKLWIRIRLWTSVFSTNIQTSRLIGHRSISCSCCNYWLPRKKLRVLFCNVSVMKSTRKYTVNTLFIWGISSFAVLGKEVLLILMLESADNHSNIVPFIIVIICFSFLVLIFLPGRYDALCSWVSLRALFSLSQWWFLKPFFM